MAFLIGGGSLGGFSTVESESRVVKKDAEMSGDGIYKGIKFKLIDEEIGKVNLDGANCSRSLGVNINEATSGVKEGGLIKGGHCGWISNSNSDELRSSDMVNANNIDIEKSELVRLHENGLNSSDVVIVNENEMQDGDCDNDVNESDSDVESDSESSSSLTSSSFCSSSSSEDEAAEEAESKEEEEEEDWKKADNGSGIAWEKLDIEEEISDADEMVAWSEDGDDDADGTAIAGPIRSRNELQVLPPVPSVSVTIQSYHQLLPVGIVSLIIGAQVIVEGVENHNPLSDGSILWITESRSVLGIVDEVFGPVKNPYYIVRYNSEMEVPARIHQGTLVSFVPEFANHALNDKNLYQKGYDVSGENDEEILEFEFSDDEKEAEYKRMLKMKRRSTNNSKLAANEKNKKQFKNRSGNWKCNCDGARKASAGHDKLPVVKKPVGRL